MKDRVAPKPARFTIDEDSSDEDNAFIVDGRNTGTYCCCDPCDAEYICAALNAHDAREKASGLHNPQKTDEKVGGLASTGEIT